MFFNSPFICQKKTRGNILLAMVAAGTVAAALVGIHNVVQNFQQQLDTPVDLAQAHYKAQKIMIKATELVTRNAVLCSEFLTPNAGCGLIDMKHTKYNDLLADFDMPRSSFSQEQGDAEDIYGGVSSSDSRESTTLQVLKLDHSNYEVTWSLISRDDPQFRSHIGTSIFEEGVLCVDNKGTPIEGQCEKPSEEKAEYWNLDQMRDKIACKNGEADIDNSQCDYFSTADSDLGLVLIRVRTQYKTNAQGNKQLTLYSVVRRPLTFFSIIRDTADATACSFRCQKSEGSDLCVGLYNDLENWNASVKFKIKNHGPGVLYHLQLRREDIVNGSNQLLTQKLISTITTPLLPGEESAEIEDEVPCHPSTHLKEAVHLVNYRCRLSRTVALDTNPEDEDADEDHDWIVGKPLPSSWGVGDRTATAADITEDMNLILKPVGTVDEVADRRISLSSSSLAYTVKQGSDLKNHWVQCQDEELTDTAPIEVSTGDTDIECDLKLDKDNSTHYYTSNTCL